jgi:hypothetical protein
MNLAKLIKQLQVACEVGVASKKPKEPGAVETEFEAIVADVRRGLEELEGTVSGEKAWELFAGLGKLLNAVEEQQTKVAKSLKAAESETRADFERLQRQLAGLHEDIRHWRMLIIAVIGGANENARTQFNSAGQWAMHYSVVRMTITTFLIGISWGVISFKWDDYSDDLKWTAWAVWALAGLFLGLFTWATLKETEKQKRIKNLIPTIRPSEHRELSKQTRMFIWFPCWVFAILTLPFGLLLNKWETHAIKKPVELFTIVEPANPPQLEVTNKIQGSEISFKSLDFSQSATNIQLLIDELEKIQSAISNSAASSTNAQLQMRETGFSIGIGRREIKSK